ARVIAVFARGLGLGAATAVLEFQGRRGGSRRGFRSGLGRTLGVALGADGLGRPGLGATGVIAQFAAGKGLGAARVGVKLGDEREQRLGTRVALGADRIG